MVNSKRKKSEAKKKKKKRVPKSEKYRYPRRHFIGKARVKAGKRKPAHPAASVSARKDGTEPGEGKGSAAGKRRLSSDDLYDHSPLLFLYYVNSS